MEEQIKVLEEYGFKVKTYKGYTADGVKIVGKIRGVKGLIKFSLDAEHNELGATQEFIMLIGSESEEAQKVTDAFYQLVDELGIKEPVFKLYMSGYQDLC